MSLAGVLFFFLFTGNVVLRYGITLLPPSDDITVKKGFRIGIIISITLASGLLAFIRMLIVLPLALDFMMPVLYLFIVSVVFILAERIIMLTKKQKSGSIPGIALDFAVNGLFYAVALIVCNSSFSLKDTVIGGLGAGSGYCAATAVLDAISRRIRLEPVAASLSGTPIYFISAGLVALAFMGLDQAFLGNMGW